MNPFTNLLFLTAMAVLAAVCATLYRARAAPKLVFAKGKSPKEGSWPCIDYGIRPSSPLLRELATDIVSFEACVPLLGRQDSHRANPLWFGEQGSSGRRGRDRHLVQEAAIVQQDEEAPQLPRYTPPFRVRARLYGELVRSFEGAGSRDQALVLKTGIKSRMPPGHRRLVEQAFAEVYETAA